MASREHVAFERSRSEYFIKIAGQLLKGRSYLQQMLSNIKLVPIRRTENEPILYRAENPDVRRFLLQLTGRELLTEEIVLLLQLWPKTFANKVEISAPIKTGKVFTLLQLRKRALIDSFWVDDYCFLYNILVHSHPEILVLENGCEQVNNETSLIVIDRANQLENHDNLSKSLIGDSLTSMTNEATLSYIKKLKQRLKSGTIEPASKGRRKRFR